MFLALNQKLKSQMPGWGVEPIASTSFSSHQTTSTKSAINWKVFTVFHEPIQNESFKQCFNAYYYSQHNDHNLNQRKTLLQQSHYNMTTREYNILKIQFFKLFANLFTEHLSRSFSLYKNPKTLLTLANL